ncbi:MAG: metalloregulator ArsR/SmtB family transcription factor [Rudaea sp.]|nr:metalloregulator ArsR/SmtB family transcription factor [Rudaea sp.]
MKISDAVDTLKALAHVNRLDLYRRMVQAGPDGVTVGALMAATGHAGATLTNHLNVLRRAGLVNDRRDGRNIWCWADYAHMNALLAHLTENCCAGMPCGTGAAACAPATIKPKRRIRR